MPLHIHSTTILCDTCTSVYIYIPRQYSFRVRTCTLCMCAMYSCLFIQLPITATKGLHLQAEHHSSAGEWSLYLHGLIKGSILHTPVLPCAEKVSALCSKCTSHAVLVLIVLIAMSMKAFSNHLPSVSHNIFMGACGVSYPIALHMHIIYNDTWGTLGCVFMYTSSKLVVYTCMYNVHLIKI